MKLLPLGLAISTAITGLAVVPEHVVRDGAVHIRGVGPDNPVLYDNDWWFDVFDNNYLWAQASLGKVDLRGNVVSRDMWDWEKGYLYPMSNCVKDGWSAYIVAKKTRYVDWGGGSFWDRDSVFSAEHFEVLPDNPFTLDMKRFIRSDLGRANQLGDGAALVWLNQPKCWTGVEIRAAGFRGKALELDAVAPGEKGDVLVIPKAATDLRVSREESFRVLSDPGLFGKR